VAKYELLIKEHDAKRMSEERSALLFQVFDNLIPHLGVFKPIFSKIREELYGKRNMFTLHNTFIVHAYFRSKNMLENVTIK